jgi:hypothetical protein
MDNIKLTEITFINYLYCKLQYKNYAITNNSLSIFPLKRKEKNIFLCENILHNDLYLKNQIYNNSHLP